MACAGMTETSSQADVFVMKIGLVSAAQYTQRTDGVDLVLRIVSQRNSAFLMAVLLRILTRV
jgi:hypothetical protein